MDLTKSWTDLVALVAGAVAVIAGFTWADGSATQPFFVLGALLVASSLWALLGAGGASGWVVAAFGLILVVSPWAWGFDGDAASAWTAWLTGAVTVLAALAVAQSRTTTRV